MNRRLKILGLVLLGLFLWKVCGSSNEGASDATAPPLLLTDRPWVDRMPEGPKAFAHMLFLKSGKTWGVTVHGSAHRHLVNAIRYKVQDGRLVATFVQDNVSIRPRYRLSECKDAPKGLDLCLDLDFRARTIRLYSARRWGPKSPPEFGGARGVLALAEGWSEAAGVGEDRSGDVAPTVIDDLSLVGGAGPELPEWLEGFVEPHGP